MKHKLTQLISLMLIPAFLWQQGAWAGEFCFALRMKDFGGASQKLRPMAAGEEERIKPELRRGKDPVVAGGQGILQAGVLPHRSKGNVNDCIVDILRASMDYFAQKVENNYGRFPWDDYYRFEEFKQWFDEERKAGDDVPEDKKLPIEKIADDYRCIEVARLTVRYLWVVRLPVKELGKIGGRPFTAHLGFTSGNRPEGIIWVAGLRDESDIQIDIMHEEEECRVVLAHAITERRSMKALVEFRDRASRDALALFKKAHIEAWCRVVKRCKNAYEREINIIPFTNLKPMAAVRRSKQIALKQKMIIKAEQHLKESLSQPELSSLPPAVGIAVVSMEHEEITSVPNSRSLLEAI